MKPFFYLFLFVAFITLSAAIIGTGVGFLTMSTAAHFFIPGHSLVGGLVSISIFLAIGIPLLSAFYGLTKLIRPYQLNQGLKRGIKYTWIAALFVTFYGLSDTFRDFKNWDSYATVNEYDLSGESVTIDIINPEHYYNSFFHFEDIEFSGSRLYSDDVFIYIEKAEGDKLTIEHTISSNGNTDHKAILNAKAVDHDLMYEDGVIKVGSYFSLSRGEKYRGQQIKCHIKIPEGKNVKFDGRAHKYIVSSYFDENVERPHTLKKHAWTMGENGLIAQAWLKENKYRKSLKVGDIATINIKGDFEVDISKSNDRELIMVGRQEVVDQIISVVQGDLLTIADENDVMDYPVKVYIKVPNIANLNSSSNHKHRLEGFNQDNMNILLTGGGDLNAYIDVKDLNITAEERPYINLTGSGESLTLDMDYYTEFNGENYDVNVLRLKQKLGRAKVKVKKIIKSISEVSSNMKIYGDPEILTGRENFDKLEETLEKVKEAINEAGLEGVGEKAVKEVEKAIEEIKEEVDKGQNR